MKVFAKFLSFLVINFQNTHTLNPDKSDAKKRHKNTYREIFSVSFSTSSRTFSEFGAVEIILFQIKVFSGKTM